MGPLPRCRTTRDIDLTLDRHPDAAVTSLIPSLCASIRAGSSSAASSA
jgi:hypothetical protein